MHHSFESKRDLAALKTESKYDLIIAGGGFAGLSLAWYLAKGGYKGQVLLVESDFTPINDKTWCFWSKDEPPFKDIIYKKWKKSWVSVLNFQSFQQLNDYTYYCLRSGDFKKHVLAELQYQNNFTLLEDDIEDLTSTQNKPVLLAKSGDSYYSDFIFQSALESKINSSDKKYPLIQHFLGWEIKTIESIFDPDTFTIMDFDKEFKAGVGFMYMLPFNKQEILLEFTVFSKSPLEEMVYKKKLRAYLYYQFGLVESDFKIQRSEFGKIPMEIQPYQPHYKNNIINIGAVGGQTKPSTGYTFSRIQKYTQILAQALIRGESPPLPTQSKFRYRYYDLLLLHILSTSSEESLKVFHSLFRNNTLDEIFKFLGEETNFRQDFKIMSSVPYLPFFKAIMKNVGYF